jgi:hypothetical protein
MYVARTQRYLMLVFDVGETNTALTQYLIGTVAELMQQGRQQSRGTPEEAQGVHSRRQPRSE